MIRRRWLLVVAVLAVQAGALDAGFLPLGAKKTGELWYDAFGKPWTVFVKDRDRRTVLRVVEGVVKDGDLRTLDIRAMIRRSMSLPPPIRVYRVDTGRDDVLVVSVLYGPFGGGPTPLRLDRRFTLTREKDILGRRPPKKLRPVAVLLKALRSKDLVARREAIRELGTRPGLAVTPHLAAALRDEFTVNTLLAIRALGRRKDPDSIPALVDCLLKARSDVSGFARVALHGYGAGIAARVIDCASPEDRGGHPHFVAARRLRALFAAWGQAALDAVHDALTGDNQRLAAGALSFAAPAIGGPRSAALVHEYLARFPDHGMYRRVMFAEFNTALRALGKIRDPSSAPLLCHYLRSLYQSAAVESLVEIGPSALPAVIDLWRAEKIEPTVTPPGFSPRQAARYTSHIKDKIVRQLVHDISVRDHQALITLYRKETDLEVRRRIIDVLGWLKARNAVPRLRVDARHKDPTIRHAVAAALGWINSPESRDGLVAMLADAELKVRGEAAVKLARARDPRVVEPLAGMIRELTGAENPRAPESLRLLHVLGASRLIEAVPVLVEFACRNDAHCRKNAVKVLRKLTGYHQFRLPEDVETSDQIQKWWQDKGQAHYTKSLAAQMRLREAARKLKPAGQ